MKMKHILEQALCEGLDEFEINITICEPGFKKATPSVVYKIDEHIGIDHRTKTVNLNCYRTEK